MPLGICFARCGGGLTAALLLTAFCSTGRGQPAEGLAVLPLEGAGAVFDVTDCCDGRTVAVEVRDARGRPVEGAQVSFLLPDHGPGGFLPEFAKTAAVATDRRGRAGVSGLRHNGVVGEWELQVAAQDEARRGSAELTMRNVLAEQAAARGRRWRGLRRWLLIGGIAGGAAAGLYAGGDFGDEEATFPRASIGVGPPQVGAP